MSQNGCVEKAGEHLRDAHLNRQELFYYFASYYFFAAREFDKTAVCIRAYIDNSVGGLGKKEKAREEAFIEKIKNPELAREFFLLVFSVNSPLTDVMLDTGVNIPPEPFSERFDIETAKLFYRYIQNNPKKVLDARKILRK